MRIVSFTKYLSYSQQNLIKWTFSLRPHEYVTPAQLKKVATHGAINKIYICVVRRPDHLVNKTTGKFDAEEYEAHPERKLFVLQLS